MFSSLLKNLQQHMNYSDQHNLCTLIYYLNRHISLDSDEHFPKALKVLIDMMGQDPQKLSQVVAAASKALTIRVKFLDGIQKDIESNGLDDKH